MRTCTSGRDPSPPLSDYDYRPYLSGNNEIVTINNPAADTWYILFERVRRLDGVTLKATVHPDVGPGHRS